MDRIPALRALERLASTMLAGSMVFAVATAALASPGASEDVPVPGGIAALARALDIDAPDAARCVSEIARLVYGEGQHHRTEPTSPYRRLMTYFSSTSSSSPARQTRSMDLVPVPLTASVWSSAVFRRSVSSQSLFAAILSDQNAALLAHGLAALDDDTLQFFADHPALVTTFYTRHARGFASFAAHLRIRNNRVVPPAGDSAVPLWEAVLNERVTNPVAFITTLFASADGRMAYLYDVIGHLDAPRAAFALGLWFPDKTVRVERFQTLARAASNTIGEWHATKAPFSRPPFDLLTLFTRVQVERSGAPGFPASQHLWAEAMFGRDGRNEDRTISGRPIDAAWLAQRVLSPIGAKRSEHLDQFAFGHRAFASAQDAATSELITAINSYPRVPMLMLTLERMGLRRPAVYAALARHAEQLRQLDPIQAHRALAQFQGAVAVTARMVRVGTIDRSTAEQLLGQLASVPLDPQRGYLGAIASWLERRVGPVLALGPGVTFDEALLQALAGPPAGHGMAPLSWEGQTYVFDLRASEVERLRRFRERHRASSIDVAIRINSIAAKLAGGALERRAIGDALAELRAALSRLPNTTRTVQELNEPLSQERALHEAVDALTADALLSFSYGAEWSDPQGPARMDRELPRRHDFGLTASWSGARARTAWAVPRLVFQPGAPWRVQGAALGLDVALASLGLRKIDSAPPLREPRMPTTDQYSFVVSLGLLDLFALRDVDGDAIAEAIARGQRRVETLKLATGDANAVIDEIAMDGWRARAVRWSLVHAPDRVPSLFSATELLYLGGGGNLDLHAWGMSALGAFACLCTRVTPPGLRAAFVGRSQLGLLPMIVPDLNLRVAIVLRELNLPAALARNVLEAALYDLLTGSNPMHSDDWLAYVRRARAVTRERVEDYVAAVTASGGPLLSSSARRVP